MSNYNRNTGAQKPVLCTKADATTGLQTWLRHGSGSLLLLCDDMRTLRALVTWLEQHSSLGPDEVLCFPERETLPYDTLSTQASVTGERLRILYRALGSSYRLLLSTVANASHLLPPRNWLLANCLVVHQGEQRSLGRFSALLADSGYERVPIVREAHEYAVRGGVLDVFLCGHPHPIRLDFCDDEIENIRYFDPRTQFGRKETVPSIQLLPACEYPQSAEARERFCLSWQKHFGGKVRGTLYQSIRETGKGAGAEYYLPLFYEQTDTLFSYLPGCKYWSVVGDLAVLGESFRRQLRTRIEERPEHHDYPVLQPHQLFLDTEQLLQHCARLEHIHCDLTLDLHTNGSAPTATNIMLERTHSPFKKYQDGLVHELNGLSAGDFVVHEHYGIGVYRGLENMEVDGVSADYIALEYANEDKLFLPIHALSLIYHYHGAQAEGSPTLHSLRSKRWNRQRQKAYKKMEDMAAKLLHVQAQRRLADNRLQATIPDEYRAFCREFPFPLTPDQEKAIDEVQADLCAAQPMDRLVCGDVGFGKTEVAMRACFIAAFNGWQSAILVPTTVLAGQHLHNFRERFAGFPLRIAALSGGAAGKEREGLLDELSRGKIDILIGTHRLLQDDVRFADLGLVVVDEEQRFGVAQKEHLLRWRSYVNLLSMTATPIPRTLNMGLHSLRQLSLITTPPSNRLPIQTYVQSWDKAVVREAIQRELARGGQLYYLHNNVPTLPGCLRMLEGLVPKATVAVVHGRMPRRAIARTMTDFYRQRADILLCTTIIESGLDVALANTIIIERADRLGLAQLHQLRGRVGRSGRQAYAWLFTATNATVPNADARRRLAAIVANNELGIGFTLATQDMEIRGAGALLGKEQSGEIADLGTAFYLRSLNRIVRKMKKEASRQHDTSEPPEQNVSPCELDLGISALLPDDWISDISVRLELYQRIANARTRAELEALQVELRDRFGRLPEPVLNLLRCSALQLGATRSDIKKISVQRNRTRVIFNEERTVGPELIAKLGAQACGEAQLTVPGAHRLSIEIELEQPQERLRFCDKLLDVLARDQHP